MLFRCGLYSANIVLIVSNLLIIQSIISYKNSEAFQSVHHVTFIFVLYCLYNFWSPLPPLGMIRLSGPPVFAPSGFSSEFVNTGGTI